jgi:hypothetical protein
MAGRSSRRICVIHLPIPEIEIGQKGPYDQLFKKSRTALCVLLR